MCRVKRVGCKSQGHARMQETLRTLVLVSGGDVQALADVMDRSEDQVKK